MDCTTATTATTTKKGIWKCSKISMHHFGCIHNVAETMSNRITTTYHFLFILWENFVSHFSINSNMLTYNSFVGWLFGNNEGDWLDSICTKQLEIISFQFRAVQKHKSSFAINIDDVMGELRASIRKWKKSNDKRERKKKKYTDER